MRTCVGVLTVVLLAGCANEPTATEPVTPTTQPTGDAAAVLRLDDGSAELTQETFDGFLRETRGLDALLKLMERQLAVELARAGDVDVTPAMIEAEARNFLDEAFPNQIGDGDVDAALSQFLSRQSLTRAEFDLTMETNAHLRAVAEDAATKQLAVPTTRAADEPTLLEREFARRYGERARARVIAVPDLRQAVEARRRITQDNEPFENVAREVNAQPELRASGGRIDVFTRQSPYSQAFLDAAFALEPGEISDPISDGGGFVIVKLEERLPPEDVELADVADELREQVRPQLVQALMQQQRRAIIGLLASDRLRIEDEVLRRQLRERLAAQQPQPVSADEARRRLSEEPQ